MSGESGNGDPHGHDPFTIDGLLRPEAFPHPVESLALHETHISWVVLTGPFAYKIKKPVVLSFLDASTLERRRAFCEEELRLNRRLAPDLYLDVVPVTRTGQRLHLGGDGEPVEYAVRMRQFQQADEMPSLLDRDAVEPRQITALGELLAAFHEQAEAAPRNGTYVHTERMREAVFDTLADLLTCSPTVGPPPDLARLADWTHERANALGEKLLQRERSGYIRECHGDLHAGNIVRLEGRLVPFDCIDFDPGLRWIDVMSDLAFLVMDLSSRGRSNFACALLNRYLEITGDYGGTELLPFYVVYRALVRAKVDAVSARNMPQQAPAYLDRLRHRLDAAGRWIHPPTPTLVIMHGLSGSGKSWLSERLVPAVPAIRIRSDIERKRLAGMTGRPAQAAFDSGLYTPGMRGRVYGHLAECTGNALESGFNVVVDASFLRAADRELFRELALRLRANYAIISCHAGPDVLSQRIAERALAGHDPSDATQEILDKQLQTAERFTAAEQPYLITVATSDPDVVARVRAQLEAIRDLAAR